MIRRPPRATLDRSSAASDVYKRQPLLDGDLDLHARSVVAGLVAADFVGAGFGEGVGAVSYTHLRAHETVLDLVCRLLLEKKNNNKHQPTSVNYTVYNETKITYITRNTTVQVS